MDEIDKQLLNRVQSDFPLTARPYRELGEPLGLTEDGIMDRMRALRTEHIVRQVSAIFDTKSLGYKSSLVAMRVAPERINDAARIINEHPGVTHNYERNHEYNLWYTIGVPPTSDLEAIAERLHEMAGGEVTRVMYTLRLFKIGVNLDMTGQRAADATAAPQYVEEDRLRAKNYAVSELDKGVIRELQEDLAVEPRPFLQVAERAGTDEAGLFAAAADLQRRGFLRRYAAILYHRKAGFKANGMGVWAVPPDDVLTAGQKMATFQNVSHCYQRPTYSDWPYNIFSMVHARSVDECEDVLRAISKATGVSQYISLYSSREYKKTRLRFYTPDYAEWEAKHMQEAVLAD